MGGQLWADDVSKTSPISIPDTELSVRVQASDGVYELTEKDPLWHFSGSVGAPLDKLKSSRGTDANGDYREISFAWTDGTLPMSGTIRVYHARPIVIFSETCKRATEMPPAPFPSFTNLPADLHVFSFRQKTFAPPEFRANDCSTPWLLFDDAANAMIISPASHFMVASMSGDGHQKITSGLNGDLRHLPAGFTQETILTFGRGINCTWDMWGKSLLAFQGAERPDNEADAVLNTSATGRTTGRITITTTIWTKATTEHLRRWSSVTGRNAFRFAICSWIAGGITNRLWTRTEKLAR